MMNKLLLVAFFSLCCLFSNKKCLNNVIIENAYLQRDSTSRISFNCKSKSKFIKIKYNYKLKIFSINNSCKNLNDLKFSLVILSKASKKDSLIETKKDITLNTSIVNDTIIFEKLSKEFLSIDDSIYIDIQKGVRIKRIAIACQQIGLPALLDTTIEIKMPKYHLEYVPCSSPKYHCQSINNDTFAICFNVHKIDNGPSGPETLNFYLKPKKNVKQLDFVKKLSRFENQEYSVNYYFRYVDKRASKEKKKDPTGRINFYAFIKDSSTNCTLKLQQLKNDTLFEKTGKYFKNR